MDGFVRSRLHKVLEEYVVNLDKDKLRIIKGAPPVVLVCPRDLALRA